MLKCPSWLKQVNEVHTILDKYNLMFMNDDDFIVGHEYAPPKDVIEEMLLFCKEVLEMKPLYKAGRAYQIKMKTDFLLEFAEAIQEVTVSLDIQPNYTAVVQTFKGVIRYMNKEFNINLMKNIYSDESKLIVHMLDFDHTFVWKTLSDEIVHEIKRTLGFWS
jgi:hypothetical protein